MEETFTFFAWCWDDESAESSYQLVITRERKYGKVTYNNNRFIWPDGYGDYYIEEAQYFLKREFIHWYNYADVTDIESFLEYHLYKTISDKVFFLKYLRSIIQGMHHFNEWELNFEGKRQVGLDWVNDRLEEEKQKSTFSYKGVQRAESSRLSFDSLFIRKFISSDKLLQLLKGKYLNQELEWVREKHDLKGLVHFLVEMGWVRTDKYATVQRILLSKITLSSSPPSRAAEPPKEASISQFQFLHQSIK